MFDHVAQNEVNRRSLQVTGKLCADVMRRTLIEKTGVGRLVPASVDKSESEPKAQNAGGDWLILPRLRDCAGAVSHAWSVTSEA